MSAGPHGTAGPAARCRAAAPHPVRRRPREGRVSLVAQLALVVLGHGVATHRILAWMLAAAALLLGGCATQKYTVDDGRPVDPALLRQIHAYGAGERAVRPAIARSRELRDEACDKQWELPFAVASSEAWGEDERVAWVRALGVDERLTVVAAAPESPLQVGERIDMVDGKRHEHDAEAMLELLAQRRDEGKPFKLRTIEMRQVTVQPFEVCRGYTRFAPPSTPELQDYHWLLSLHPLELAQAALSEDEALWVVLWTQGLSEEGGMRMKTWHYGSQIVGTLYNIATLASGLKGAAVAADAAMQVARNAAAQVASDFLKQQLIEQARAFAAAQMRDALGEAAAKLARAAMVGAMQQAAVNRGSLGGVARMAATVFERADQWAFDRMRRLHASPLAGFTLHRKLALAGLAANAFVFDGERLEAISALAAAQGLEQAMVAALDGIRPDSLVQEIGAMPLASAPEGFSYEDAAEPAGGPFASGLIDSMLDMPIGANPRSGK